jgi:hypothetical protein
MGGLMPKLPDRWEIKGNDFLSPEPFTVTFNGVPVAGGHDLWDFEHGGRFYVIATGTYAAKVRSVLMKYQDDFRTEEAGRRAQMEIEMANERRRAATAANAALRVLDANND